MNYRIFAALADYCMSMLRSEGYDLPGSVNSSDEKMLLYLGAAARFVERRKRTVHKSSSLSCPPNMQTGLEAILRKMERGEDLRPYQSKLVDQSTYNDGMYNHLGIQHFHLGFTIESDGWAARTGELLFAIVTDDDVFCLDIRGHGSWSDQDLIQIVHNDFPHLIKTRKMNVLDLATTYSDEEIGNLHQSNVNVLLKMDDGTIYGPLGGVVASGRRLEDVRMMDQMKSWCANLEGRLLEEINGEFGAQIQLHSNFENQELKIDSFDIDIRDGNLIVLEPITGEQLTARLPQLKPI